MMKLVLILVVVDDGLVQMKMACNNARIDVS